jgi:hypothetical protein
MDCLVSSDSERTQILPEAAWTREHQYQGAHEELLPDKSSPPRPSSKLKHLDEPPHTAEPKPGSLYYPRRRADH